MLRSLLNILSMLNKSNMKGMAGERVTRSSLAKLKPNQYKVLNDVTLEISQGKTTQIDHIVVSIYGIFVVETKNYKGMIFGKEDDQNWTQALFQQSHQFYNPIKQNQGHIYALKALLRNYSSIPYFSMISFAPQAQLKIKIRSEYVFVLYMSQLRKMIKRVSKTQVLSIEEVEQIVQRIQEKNKKGFNVRSEHISNIQTNLRSKRKKVNHSICPECNHSLVVRSGPYGEFLGCSNYPKCNFKQK